MMVVLINIMVRNNLTMEECLAVAYEDIKDRKGKMIDGIFVKEGTKTYKLKDEDVFNNVIHIFSSRFNMGFI